MAESVFKVGDVVRLKSGGQLMTVGRVYDFPPEDDTEENSAGERVVICAWVDASGQEHALKIAVATLELVRENN